MNGATWYTRAVGSGSGTLKEGDPGFRAAGIITN